jgi:hypothetical protein
MRQKTSKRLEALEREADREALANAFPVAIAYYLGGARHMSEVGDAYAKALRYKDLDELCQAFADLLRQPSDSVANRRTFERTRRAQCQLLAKFGYDLSRASPAALADAFYPIVRTLPEEWLAALRSAHRKSCEAKARFRGSDNGLLLKYLVLSEVKPESEWSADEKRHVQELCERILRSKR